MAGWKPLLKGDLRRRALATVEEIAAAIPEALESPDLAAGHAGVALFYCYLSAWRERGDDNTSAEHLNQALRAAAGDSLPPGLYHGLAGIAWTDQHIRSRLLPGDPIDHHALDQALLAYAGQSPWRGDYDLISGLVGLGLYAVERLPRSSAAALLERVIDRLAETAERTEAGVTWFTPPEQLEQSIRDTCPAGYYNTGLAHGAPGVIALLGLACGAGIATEKARPLLDAAVRWLLAHRRPEAAGYRFDYWVAPGDQAAHTRSAWCYGDPGVATALLLASGSVADPWWHPEALAVAVGGATRPPELSGVKDAGLCHGAGGLGHLFNRMFQRTGDPRFGRAARYWFERALELHRPGEGTAGFDSAGFLSGAAGIGLALLAASVPGEPEWDRVLFSSGSGSGGRG